MFACGLLTSWVWLEPMVTDEIIVISKSVPKLSARMPV